MGGELVGEQKQIKKKILVGNVTDLGPYFDGY